MFSTRMPKGTKVIRETSLVMNMLEKKHRKTSVRATPLVVETLPKIRLPIICRKFSCRSPSMMSIRQNRRISVLKSRYST